MTSPPSSLAVSACTLTINVNKITITGGSVGSQILNLLIGALKNAITNTLASVGCNMFTTAAKGQLSTYLQELDALLAPYIGPTPPPDSNSASEAVLVSHAGGKKLLALSSGPTIALAADILNTVMNSTVSSTCAANQTPSGAPLIDDLISTLNDKDGWLTVPLGIQLNNYDALTTSSKDHIFPIPSLLSVWGKLMIFVQISFQM
jgi:hypothetical protein